MSTPDFYRYFFAFRPDPLLRCWLAALAESAGQSTKRIKAEYFHLTLCVIAESVQRDRFIASYATSALADRALFSCPFWLGRLHGGARGSAMRVMPRQHEIQNFYRTLLTYLGERDIFPLHRKSGLRPHVTLGYDSCVLDPRVLPREWIPEELLLIESEVGRGIHHVIARWSLLPPRQGSFVFAGMPRLAA
jgi:2'-5' RNA ligase